MSEANNSFEKIEFVPNLESKKILESSADFPENQTEEQQNKDREIDWHRLAHKLREHNRKLLKKVFQLEQEIIESNKALEEHIKRSRSNDLYVAKQADIINEYQEEIAELGQKITTYQQEKSSQKFVIDNLENKLNISERNNSKLEQKCNELQQEKDLQTRELLEKEQQIQELNIRFNRQQQYLLQYRANKNNRTTSQPIKAWSAENIEKKSPTTVVSPKINATDWATPAIAKKQAKINSIAAVQLPRFPRQAENE